LLRVDARRNFVIFFRFSYPNVALRLRYYLYFNCRKGF